MKASEAMRGIIERERELPGRPCLVISMDKVLISKSREMVFVTYEDLEKSFIEIGE